MAQTHIFLTQTSISKDYLNQILAYDFFVINQGWGQFSKQINELLKLEREVVSNFTMQLMAERKMITQDFNSKQEYREAIMTLYERYQHPVLAFLGNISEYSIQLQEGMLRLLEEPPSNLYIVLYADSISGVLGTVTSRSLVHSLTKDEIFQLLSADKIKVIKEKLPPVKDTIKSISKGVLPEIKDINKLERDEIQFWLWQLKTYLEEYYKTNPDNQISNLLYNTHYAQSLNSKNVQKKFVFQVLNLLPE